jgi:hypothetical protein
MSLQQIPMTSGPNQSFQTVVEIDGGRKGLQFKVRFNGVAGYWVMTISDSKGVLLLDSIPLLPGLAPSHNILEQHSHLRIGSAYLINVGNVADDYPGEKGFDKDFVLIWGDTANV